MDQEAAVLEGRREGTDQGNRLGCPGAKGSRLVVLTDGADHICHAAVVAGVQDAAKLLVILEKGVGFVDEERRPPLLYGPEHTGALDARDRHCIWYNPA